MSQAKFLNWAVRGEAYWFLFKYSTIPLTPVSKQAKYPLFVVQGWFLGWDCANTNRDSVS